MKPQTLFKLKFYCIILSLVTLNFGCSAQQSEKKGWDDLSMLMKKIVPPKFANHDYSILNYGAKADGKTDCLPSIKTAIDACSKGGGGRVIIPRVRGW